MPEEETLPASEAIPAEQMQPPLAPQKQYAANMGSVIRALTRSRANGQLLHDSEWRAYEEAIASGRCCTRVHPSWQKICSYRYFRDEKNQVGFHDSPSNIQKQQGS